MPPLSLSKWAGFAIETGAAASRPSAVGTFSSVSSIMPAGTIQGNEVAIFLKRIGIRLARIDRCTAGRLTKAARLIQAGGDLPVRRRTSSSVNELQLLREQGQVSAISGSRSGESSPFQEVVFRPVPGGILSELLYDSPGSSLGLRHVLGTVLDTVVVLVVRCLQVVSFTRDSERGRRCLFEVAFVWPSDDIATTTRALRLLGRSTEQGALGRLLLESPRTGCCGLSSRVSIEFPIFWPERVTHVDCVVVPQAWHPLRGGSGGEAEDARGSDRVVTSERVFLSTGVVIGRAEGKRDSNRGVVDSSAAKVEQSSEFRGRKLRGRSRHASVNARATKGVGPVARGSRDHRL